jgi:hypothetical protein
VGRVLFASLLGVLAAASPATGAVVEVTSTLPEWLAPGGRLAVSGWAAPSERVTLRSQGGALARVWAGPRGGFRIKAHVTAAGRTRLSLLAGGIETRLGVVPVRPLRLAAVGDVTFGNGVARMIGLYGARYPWLSVAPVLRRADIALVNLEGAVSTSGTPVPNKEFHFRGPPAALAAAGRFAGVDVVSVANNHTLDYGRVARFVGWSLGNFVFGASSPGTERTGILGLELGRHGVLGHGFRRARIVRYQPRLL